MRKSSKDLQLTTGLRRAALCIAITGDDDRTGDRRTLVRKMDHPNNIQEDQGTTRDRVPHIRNADTQIPDIRIRDIPIPDRREAEGTRMRLHRALPTVVADPGLSMLADPSDREVDPTSVFERSILLRPFHSCCAVFQYRRTGNSDGRRLNRLDIP